MALEVKLQAFEGPLDLLLHLIEKSKVDIYDIPIVEITDQYLETIRRMEEADMNVMSEFLVMAATLLDIKARMLLPREKDEEGEEEDPRSELVEKLLEYKAYKYMAQELADLETDAQRAFYREPSLPPEVEGYRQPVDYEELLRGVTLSRLNEVFQACLKRQEDRKDPVRSHFGRIEKDEVSIELKAGYVASYIRNHRKLNFRELLENRRSRMDVIVTFLVVLELMKTGAVSVSQEGIEEDIIITVSDMADGLENLRLTSLGEQEEDGRKDMEDGRGREEGGAGSDPVRHGGFRGAGQAGGGD